MAADVADEGRFRELAESLVERVDRLAGAVADQAREDFPEWTVDRPELWEMVRVGAPESIGAELRMLAMGGEVPSNCPEVDAEGARVAARAGVPLSVVLHLYRLGHSAQWEAWFDAVETTESDPARRRDMLARGSRFFFAYASRLSEFVTDEYTRERDRLLRDREHRHAHLVRELLEGRSVDVSSLDYEPDAHHIGLVAWGAGVPALVRSLAGGLGRTPLLVGLTEETWWAWLGAPGPVDREAAASIAAVAVPPDTGLAVGPEAWGAEGFRRSHAQAVAAQRIGLRTGAAITRYEDVVLEALLARDEDEARELIRRELSGIDGRDGRSATLRATLRAYFASGHNAAATAAALGVHEQTVAQRLRAVEQRTGHLISVRRAELEMALRLRESIGAGP
ncbi:MAG TPA: helix-turn-helix domain-containing protein [Thermoleophilaceae bacterium]|nr:helix-turn-helix domain-containing protein [Thermoleophilaceae bacterium]